MTQNCVGPRSVFSTPPPPHISQPRCDGWEIVSNLRRQQNARGGSNPDISPAFSRGQGDLWGDLPRPFCVDGSDRRARRVHRSSAFR